MMASEIRIPIDKNGISTTGNKLFLPDYKFGELLEKFPKMAAVYNTDQIAVMTNKEIELQILESVNTAFIELGHKIDPGTSATLTYQIARELHQQFPLMRIGEIKHVIKTGVRGGYIETENKVTINLVRVLKWLSEYRTSNERKEFVLAMNSLAEKNEEPSEKDKYFMAAQNAFNSFRDYKEEKDIYMQAGVVYDFLVSCDLINYTKEIKKDIWKRAEIEIKRDLTNKMHDPKFIKRSNIFKDQIEQIKSSSYKDDGEFAQKIVSQRAKRLGLYQFFDSLIELGLDLMIPKKNFD